MSENSEVKSDELGEVIGGSKDFNPSESEDHILRRSEGAGTCLRCGKTFDKSSVKGYLLRHGAAINMEFANYFESNLCKKCLRELSKKHELFSWDVHKNKKSVEGIDENGEK